MKRMILIVKCSQLYQITDNKSKDLHGYEYMKEIQTIMKSPQGLVFCVSYKTYLFNSDRHFIFILV